MLKFRSAYTKEPKLCKTSDNCLINWAIELIIPNAVFSKVPTGKQLPSFKKSDQNTKKKRRYETFLQKLRFKKKT